MQINADLPLIHQQQRQCGRNQSKQAWLVSTWAILKCNKIELFFIILISHLLKSNFIPLSDFTTSLSQSCRVISLSLSGGWAIIGTFGSWPLRSTSASIICAEPQWRPKRRKRKHHHITLFLKLDHDMVVRKTKEYCRSKANASSYLYSPCRASVSLLLLFAAWYHSISAASFLCIVPLLRKYSSVCSLIGPTNRQHTN